MTFRAAMIPALTALLLAACSTATPYQPSWMGDGYGYEEQRIEENRFRVTFTGNGATPAETVKNHLLYRAAELTLAQGGEHFIITARRAAASPERTPTTSIGTGVGIGSGGRVSSGWQLGVGVPLGAGDGPTAMSAEIVIHPGLKPAGNPDAYNAREVIASLGPRIVRPGP